MDYIIDEKMIKKQLADMLTEAGFNVVAAEVEEGFKKPGIFLEVLPSHIERLCSGMEEVTDTVTVRYIPHKRTYEHALDVLRRIRKTVLYQTIDVGRRRLTAEEMDITAEDGYNLVVTFDLTYQQAAGFDTEEYDDMEELELGGI